MLGLDVPSETSSNNESVGVADDVIEAISIDEPDTRTFFQFAIVNYR